MAKQYIKKKNADKQSLNKGLSTYTVKSGETLYTIATKLKKDVHLLAAINGGTAVRAGQVITIQ